MLRPDKSRQVDLKPKHVHRENTCSMTWSFTLYFDILTAFSSVKLRLEKSPVPNITLKRDDTDMAFLGDQGRGGRGLHGACTCAVWKDNRRIMMPDSREEKERGTSPHSVPVNCYDCVEDQDEDLPLVFRKPCWQLYATLISTLITPLLY